MINRMLYVGYDIVPSESVTSQAINFNVADWTLLPYLSGHTGATANMQVFLPSENILAYSSANVRVVFQASQSSTPVVRVVSIHYDASNNPVWDYNWGSFTKRPQYDPDNQTVDISAKLAAWLQTPGIASPQLTLQVNGIGVLQEGRVEIGYSVPDFSDDISAMEAQIAALQTKVGLA